MPIYEFVCKKCGQIFERLVFSSQEKVLCPKCKAEEVQKLLSCFSSRSQSPGQGIVSGCNPASRFG
ncbi:zinc ribbon domain-containing protein [Thermosulfuriphilus ammonigenes]|uniref:Zinc ribbon domain-containing protein n=1 Tax=Thermosulfuriphilus ammonigenes TaxID=1936021 RepID=A0A6G7PXY9_9BACT|nr:zinc ribbon domain-containing protein [Thermosulfuriphilus ammonigenes]MBA2849627.1 putative FmdB family regulatory protein [Thermosulfuriphilus ammonigenes]QIJ72273.1 zinc ribbon domain-containing protein [Thermosulfuriphilus ammonigenes]